MATEQDTAGPRPWVIGDFVRSSRIIVGDESSAPYRRGCHDLAKNANTLMARLRKPLVTDCQDSTALITLTTSFQTFGWYVLRVPGINGRTTLRTQMRIGTTIGGTYEVKVSFIPVSGTTRTATYSGTTANGWISWDTTSLLEGETYIVKLEARYTAVGGSWTPQAIYIDQLSNTSATLSGMSWTLEGVHPLDVDQYEDNQALSVIMARECLHNNNVLYASQTNTVASAARWHIHTSGTTSTVATGLRTWYGPSTVFASASIGGKVGLIKEWLYYPRPGVKNLLVYANGFVTSWGSSSDTAQFTLRFKNHEELRLPFTIAQATANYAVGNWVLFGSELRVPDVGGPLRLQLFGGYPTASRFGYIQTLTMIEAAPTIPTYG